MVLQFFGTREQLHLLFQLHKQEHTQLQQQLQTVVKPQMQCKFSLQGFPTEGLNPETAGAGILDYISCCVAWIYRKEDPWYSTSWGLIPFEEIPKRTKIVKDLIILCTKNLLEKLPLPITSELNNIIKERRESLRLEQSRDLPSKNDKLPTGFTPEAFVTFPPTVQNIPTKGDSYNKVTAMNVSSLDAPKRSLSYRLSVIYGQLKAEAYKKAEKEGLVFSQSERSDSYAAPIALKDLKKGYLQLLGTTEGLENEARDIYYSLREFILANGANVCVYTVVIKVSSLMLYGTTRIKRHWNGHYDRLQ